MSYEGNEEHWFRFTSLSEEQVSALRRHCPELEVRTKRNVKDLFVASFRLRPASNYQWLTTLLAKREIAEDTYGVFTSLVTNHDSEIVTLPPFVLELHKRTGGQIEFSFTMVPESS
jgi:hypothetical protein